MMFGKMNIVFKQSSEQTYVGSPHRLQETYPFLGHVLQPRFAFWMIIITAKRFRAINLILVTDTFLQPGIMSVDFWVAILNFGVSEC